MSYIKPLPALDPESRPFWEAARAHQLKIMRCTACKRPHFPATSFCPFCRSNAQEWIDAKGTGSVFSWIVVRHPVPRDVYASDVPYVVALVELDEGVRMPTNLIDIAPEKVAAGMKVKVAFRDVTPEISLPVFKPA